MKGIPICKHHRIEGITYEMEGLGPQFEGPTLW